LPLPKRKRVQAFWFLDNTRNIDYEEAFHSFEHPVQFAKQERAGMPEPGFLAASMGSTPA
jgi:hypothetical protein